MGDKHRAKRKAQKKHSVRPQPPLVHDRAPVSDNKITSSRDFGVNRRSCEG
jgi:hypothetical protein